jgi:glutamate N-acetyltransferase/amino-acid N-acetyltransferase
MPNEIDKKTTGPSVEILGKVFDVATTNYQGGDYLIDGKPSLMLPAGFRASGTCSGALTPEKVDLGIIIADEFCGGAAYFQRNHDQTAPILWSEAKTREGRAILACSGNVFFGNGDIGYSNCQDLAESVGKELGLRAEEVLVASSGFPEVPLNKEAFVKTIPDLCKKSHTHRFIHFAASILASDLKFRVVIFRVQSPTGKPYRIFTCGEKSVSAGMFSEVPLMAFILTDLPVASELLEEILPLAVKDTLSSFISYGIKSSGDSVFIMSSGTNGDAPVTSLQSIEAQFFLKVLKDTLEKLAEFLVSGDSSIGPRPFGGESPS